MMRPSLLICIILTAGCTDIPPKGKPVPSRTLAHDVATYSAPRTMKQARPVKIEPTGNLSLQQALALSLLYNPQLEAYAWDLRAQEASILQSYLAPNPVLGIKLENFGGNDTQSEFDSLVSTLRINQVIELGNKRLKRSHLAQENYTLTAWDFETQRLNVIEQTGHRYIDILAAHHNLTLAKKALALAEDLYAIVSNQSDQGTIPKSERNKAQVQVTARKIEMENQSRQLNTLRHHLAAMWDSSEVGFQELDGDLLEIPDLPEYELLVKYLKHNPDLARWTTEIAMRQAAITLAKTDAIPNLTLGAGVRHFNTTDDHAFVLEMGIPIPLINRNQGEILQARYDLLKTMALQRHAHITVQTTLYKMYQTLSANHFAVTSLVDQSLPAIRAAYDSALQAFSQGITDYLNVLDAERTLIDTQYDLINSLAAYQKTFISLESFLGTSFELND